MILIKDRHLVQMALDQELLPGKYDTYKGSTHDSPAQY